MERIADLVKQENQNKFLINGTYTELIDLTGEALPMVTVTMPAYNHEKFIARAIEGVISQITNFKFVLLIGEDFSNDKTREIVLSYQNKYPKLIQIKLPESNLGMMENSVSNMFLCRGKYIAMCEGDDYWTDPYKLQKQVDFLENNSEYVMCFHKIKILMPNGELKDDFITQVPQNYETQETLARLGNYIHTPSVVFKNNAVQLPDIYMISPMGDYFLYLLLTQKGKIGYIEDCMAVYRYGVGIHSTKSKINLAKTNVKVFALLASYFKNPMINEIFLDRHTIALSQMEQLIKSEYEEAFVSNNIVLKALVSLKEPKKFLKKLKNKIRL